MYQSANEHPTLATEEYTVECPLCKAHTKRHIGHSSYGPLQCSNCGESFRLSQARRVSKLAEE